MLRPGMNLNGLLVSYLADYGFTESTDIRSASWVDPKYQITWKNKTTYICAYTFSYGIGFALHAGPESPILKNETYSLYDSISVFELCRFYDKEYYEWRYKESVQQIDYEEQINLLKKHGGKFLNGDFSDLPYMKSDRIKVT